jgi:hypothetical protein
MSCCGNKRAAASVALRRGNEVATPRQAPLAVTPVAVARAADVHVRYLGVRPVRVRGPASGRTYHTSSADPMLTIDARDAAALARTGLFRTAGAT